MTDAPNTTDIERAWLLARNERGKLETDKRVLRSAAIHEFTLDLDKKLDAQFDDRIIAAREAEHGARLLHEDELIEDGRKKLAKKPSGVMVEYEFERFRNVKKLTGRRGVFRLRERDTPMPGNVSHYQWPDMGAVFIRILKKDGTESAQYANWSSVGRWIPEGTPL